MGTGCRGDISLQTCRFVTRLAGLVRYPPPLGFFLGTCWLLPPAVKSPTRELTAPPFSLRSTAFLSLVFLLSSLLMLVTVFRELSGFLRFLTSVGSFHSPNHQGCWRGMRGTLCPFPHSAPHWRWDKKVRPLWRGAVTAPSSEQGCEADGPGAGSWTLCCVCRQLTAGGKGQADESQFWGSCGAAMLSHVGNHPTQQKGGHHSRIYISRGRWEIGTEKPERLVLECFSRKVLKMVRRIKTIRVPYEARILLLGIF